MRIAHFTKFPKRSAAHLRISRGTQFEKHCCKHLKIAMPKLKRYLLLSSVFFGTVFLFLITGTSDSSYSNGKSMVIEIKSQSQQANRMLRNDYIVDKPKSARPKVAYLMEPVLKSAKMCSGTCVNEENLKWQIVTFVKSAASHAKRRMKIRQTWGSIHQVDGALISTVFVIGKSSDDRINRQVRAEHRKYGDILQYNGADNYSNIAIKTLSGMQWAAENLAAESFYTSADDDFVINIPRLVSGVEKYAIQKEKNDWGEFPIVCGFVKGVDEKVVRFDDPNFAKWAISKEAYRWTKFPTYCHGGVYTTSVNVISQLYVLSRREKLLHLDDVFITGVLRWKIGMPDNLVVSSLWPTGFHEGDDVEFFVRIETMLKTNVDKLLNIFGFHEVCKCNAVQ